MMQVNFDLKPFLGVMGAIPEELRRELRKELKQQTVEVQKLARKEHRHTTRTGSLNSSIQRKEDERELTGEVFFDTGIANYGPYVHEGHGSWKPDQFLYQAIEKREPMIISALENAVKRGLKEAGA